MMVKHCEEREIETLSGLLSPRWRGDIPCGARRCAPGGLEGVRV